MTIAIVILGGIALVGAVWLWMNWVAPGPVHETREVEQPVPPQARCWASKRDTLLAVGDQAMQDFLERRRAEEAACELPELHDERARELVEQLRSGVEVDVELFKDLPDTWRVTTDGKLLDRPLHWYRIDGKRIDYNRGAGTMALFAEEWM